MFLSDTLREKSQEVAMIEGFTRDEFKQWCFNAQPSILIRSIPLGVTPLTSLLLPTSCYHGDVPLNLRPTGSSFEQN